MNYFVFLLIIFTLYLNPIYANSKSIQYTITTIDGKNVYHYNGKNYNSEAEMIEQIRKDFGSQGQTYATNKDQGIIPVSAQISSNIWANYYYDTDSKEDFTDMKRRMLFQTNEYRKLHKVPELTLDSTLANEAQNYANYIAKINRLEHDPKNKQNGWGENLAMGSSSVAYLAVKWWYDEIKKYDFNKPGYQAGTGHFTQLVWKGTSKAGFGVAANGGIVYIVCKYSPPGNYLNLFSENVFRPVRQ